MKNILSVITILVSASSFATNSSVLTKSESNEIVNYLNNICPDTYCGGDYNYYPQDIQCDETSCTLTMRIQEYYQGDLSDVNTKLGESVTKNNYKVTMVDVSTQEAWSLDIEGEALVNAADFICVISKLQKSNQSLSDKTQTFYDYTVSNCVPMIESFL
jgi:hypothetical protein